MKIITDPNHVLAEGLAAIRAEFDIPRDFPPDVLAAAQAATARTPDEHRDRTAEPFVTLDPASSTDLDQAFAIDRRGAELLLHYAIADVAWFVDDGDPVDAEAWRRGATQYLPDGKAGLYPPLLGEGAASLLPDVERPAVVFSVLIDADGDARLDGVERAVIRSRAKLAYDSVRPEDLPSGFAELADRVRGAEDRRGASRVDPPEQEVVPAGDGQYQLAFRQRAESEDQNAALSLATNLAVADLLQKAGTGLFRVMAEPDAHALERLRQTARAFALDWPEMASLDQFERTLDARNPRAAAFMMAVRRAGGGASYVPYRAGETPWHAPMAATYAHATAPLRRLADRYVLRAALAVANGRPAPDAVTEAFSRLPAVMARADATAGRIERAVVDLAELVTLQGHEGNIFPAVATDVDERGTRIQLCDFPVAARVNTNGLKPGDELDVRLASLDPARRAIRFERAG